MKTFVKCMAAGAVILAGAAPVKAQLLYVGVRGGAGVPSGTFGESASGAPQDGALRGAKPGVGYGLDAGVGLGPIGFYAGLDHIDFGCDAACASNGKYKLTGISAGVRLGVPLIPIVKPWVKAGVTFNEVNGTTVDGKGLTNIATDRTPGYEMGAGIDIPIMMLFSLTPQVRYVGQKLDYKGLSAGSKTNVSYYTFDLGLRARTPF